MINLKLNAWTFAQITPKKEKKSDKEKEEEVKRRQENCAGWEHLTKFLQKWVKFFGGFIKLVRGERFTSSPLITAFQWVSWKRWDQHDAVLCNVKPLIFNLINGAVCEVTVGLSIYCWVWLPVSLLTEVGEGERWRRMGNEELQRRVADVICTSWLFAEVLHEYVVSIEMLENG